jgi:hypothetical protein
MDLIRVLLQDKSTGKSTTEEELKIVLGDNAQVTALCANVQVLGSTKAATLAVAVRDAFDSIVTSDNLSIDQLLSRADGINLKVRAFVDAAHDDLND